MQNTRLMSQKMHRLPDEWTATDPWPSLWRCDRVSLPVF
jgi:hypothetical protein